MVGSASTLNSFGSKLLQMTVSGGQARVRMAHYKGTIVVVKLLSKKGATFTHVDEIEMTAVSLAIRCKLTVHTSNNVEATFDFFETTFDFFLQKRQQCRTSLL